MAKALTLTQKMKIMTGYCSACGADVIDQAKKRLPVFREHKIELSNGSIMTVAVCEKCKAKIVSGSNIKTTANKILTNYKTYWNSQSRKPVDTKTVAITETSTDARKTRKKKALARHKSRETDRKKKKKPVKK